MSQLITGPQYLPIQRWPCFLELWTCSLNSLPSRTFSSSTSIYFVQHNSLKIVAFLHENNCSDVVIVFANPIWESKFSCHVFSFWCSLIPDENPYSTKYFKIVEKFQFEHTIFSNYKTVYSGSGFAHFLSQKNWPVRFALIRTLDSGLKPDFWNTNILLTREWWQMWHFVRQLHVTKNVTWSI